MVRKYIYIFALLVVTTLSYALINSATALADGEKWTLTDKTTVKVTGGALGGTTVTLKPNSGNGRSDPSVWTETGSKSAFFTSGTDKICARINGLNDIDANRSKTGSIDLVDPGWCSDPIAPGGGGVRGPTGSTGLSTKATLTSTIATTPLKCGDAGFTGPCAEPFNPATTDCSTVADATARTRCESIKVCIVENEKSADECTSGWDACMATYADADEGAKGAGVVNCANAIKKANFEEGKYVEPAGEETSNCKIEGIGWLLCPAMNFMGMITDGSYQLVEGMLVTPVSMFNSTSTEGQSTRAVWEIMRNIANSLFVIAFMVIIYSQLTSTGITNYGVKKLLPKLVIAAILVNLSFIVCALAIDLSNVIGAATKGLFDSLGGLIEIPDSDGMNIGNGGGGWLYIVGMVLSAGGAAAIIYAQIALLLPMLVGALAAIVTVVIVLTMRQALIILLVIISPLAFVALLLPNTEGWFKKWRSIFFVMLLMFPAVAAIFGASALAGKIVMNSSDGDILVQIAGAGITIIPLFITPVIMKAAGGVLNRFAGIVNNTDKGMFDRMRNRAGKFGDRIQNDRTGKRLNRSEAVLKGTSGSRFLGTGNTRRRKAAAFIAGVGSTYDITAAEKDKNAKSSADAASRSYVADRALNDESYAKKLANNDASMTTLVQAYAKQAVKEESVKDVKAEEVLLSDKSVQNLFRVLSDTSQSSTRRAAAANQIYSRGGDDAVHEAVNYLGTTRAAGGQGAESAGEIQKLSAESFSSRKPAAIGGADASAYKTGNFSGDYESKLLKRIQDGKFGEREWSGMNPDELKRAANAVHNANQAGNFTQAQYDTVRRALDSAEQNKNIQLTPEQKIIFDDLKQVKQPTIQLANPNFADPRTIPRN